MDFYCGSVLRLDLASASATIEPLNLDWAALYLGGKGLMLRYLWEEVPRGIDPWSPDNPVILMTGPFCGTSVTTASRLVVGCKSPVTGILNDSYVGGSFGPEMKFAGYDAIIITGESPKPVVVTVLDDKVAFLSAEPAYWGLLTSEIEEALRRDFHPQAKTLSVGPAGEIEIPFACLSPDQYHKAGRGGHGMVWGHKKLKAISVRGTGAVHVGNTREFLDALYVMHRDRILTEDNLWANEEGTPALTQIMSDAGVMPTRNWSTGTFEGVEAINADAFAAVRTRNRACYQCALGCRQFHDVEGITGEGPEYETIAMCGTNCGVGDMSALVKFNHLCDELGLDTISTGNVLGLAMDLAEKGVADFDLRFGRLDTYLEAPEAIVRREGVGAELARGSRALAAKYGRPDLAYEVKKLELPGYDPRGSFSMSIAYATADRGGCHMRSYPIADEVISGKLAPDTLEGNAHKLIHGDPAEGMIGEDFCCTKFSGIWCDFWAITPTEVCELQGHVYQREVTRDEVFTLGERIWNLGRLFNLREGVEPDDIPHRLYTEEGMHTSGTSAGRVIGAEHFWAALREVYELRGWDEQGVPSEAKLAELGVDVRLDAGGADGASTRPAVPASESTEEHPMHEADPTERLTAASLLEAVGGRRSVRRFLADPVPREDVRAMVALAVRAANAGNAQVWRFVAVEDEALRAAMRAAVDGALDEMAAWPELEGMAAIVKALRAYSTFFAAAPLVVAVFGLPYQSRGDDLLVRRGLSQEQRDRLRARPDLQSIGAAVQLLCTAAHALGYGSCWMSAPVLAAPAIERLLEMPPAARLVALVPVGLPAAPGGPTARLPLDDVLQFR